MGPMQHWLTTATPFKSQKILFKARALGSNLIHRRLSTSQLPILDPPSPVTWFTSFLSCPPTPYGLPLPSFARFCDIRISSTKIFPSFQLKVTDCITTHQQNSVLLHVLVYVLAPQSRQIDHPNNESMVKNNVPSNNVKILKTLTFISPSVVFFLNVFWISTAASSSDTEYFILRRTGAESSPVYTLDPPTYKTNKQTENAKCVVSTRVDSQLRFLAQHSVATLLRHCFEWLEHCSNIAALCCAKNRRCKSSRKTTP